MAAIASWSFSSRYLYSRCMDAPQEARSDQQGLGNTAKDVRALRMIRTLLCETPPRRGFFMVKIIIGQAVLALSIRLALHPRS